MWALVAERRQPLLSLSPKKQTALPSQEADELRGHHLRSHVCLSVCLCAFEASKTTQAISTKGPRLASLRDDADPGSYDPV